MRKQQQSFPLSSKFTYNFGSRVCFWFSYLPFNLRVVYDSLSMCVLTATERLSARGIKRQWTSHTISVDRCCDDAVGSQKLFAAERGVQRCGLDGIKNLISIVATLLELDKSWYKE
jgi:hypothetical protein